MRNDKILKIIILSVFCIASNSCTDCQPAVERVERDMTSAFEVVSTEEITTSVEENESLSDSKYSLIYSSLTRKEQLVYREIYNGVLQKQNQIKITAVLTPSEFEYLYNMFMIQQPEFYAVADMIEYNVMIKTGYVSGLSLTYKYSEDEMVLYDAIIEECVNEVKKQVEGKEIPEKLAILHDFIIRNTEYSSDDYDLDSIYSVFVESKATCTGYAKTFKYLCDQFDIPCICVTGVATENHMWNMVYLDDCWSFVDCTWDDPDFGDKNIMYHDYFLVSFSQMTVTHEMDSFYLRLLKLGVDNNA